ncbi:MAG: hypothetical protein AB1330_10405 [Bacillota bacterium]
MPKGTASLWFAQKRFTGLLRKTEEALCAGQDARSLLLELKAAAAKLEAERNGGRVVKVKRRAAGGKASVSWAVWPEPEGYYGRAFLAGDDLSAFAEAPEKFLPKGDGILDGACVFCGRTEELGGWEFVQRCARVHEIFGSHVTFWVFDGERYVAQTLEVVSDLAEAVRDPAGRRKVLRQMDKVVDIRDLRAIKKLTEAR